MSDARPHTLITRFEDVLDASRYQEVPGDHWIALTDIRGSTAAIEAGRYKDVNTLGAATIIAVLNACAREPIPYVFGGDGATLVIPPHRVEAVRTALRGCKQSAQQAFGFDLRCALIRVADLQAAGVRLEVGHYEVAPGVALPAFRGGALALADRWAKDPETAKLHAVTLIPDQAVPEPDFTGLECRWKPIPSLRGQVASLIVQFQSECPDEAARGVIRSIARAGGWSEKGAVFQRSQLQLAISARELFSESRMRTAGKSRLSSWLLAAWLGVLSLLIGRLLYRFRPRGFLGGTDWASYFEGVQTQVDDRKYDDVLRAVIDSSESDWKALKQELDEGQSRGWLRYGAHLSSEILMTCMVLDRALRHIHFVDGAEGGYAMASRSLKGRST